MEGFIIALSIATSIFFIVAIVTLIRRQQRAKQNVGYVVSEGGAAPVMVTSASHAPPGGATVTHYPPPRGGSITHYPPPGYQANYPPGSYAYPAQTTSYVQVQGPVQMQCMSTPMSGMPAPYPPMQQRSMDPLGAEPSVLPANFEKPTARQTHQGAVETVSQI